MWIVIYIIQVYIKVTGYYEVHLTDWLTANKLSLNLDKTKYILFHTKQRAQTIDISCKIHCNNQEIERVVNFNFLGIFLNENLSWKQHINAIANKLSKTIGIMKLMKKYVANNTLKLLYNSLFLPYINYGILSWGSSYETDINRIIKLQKQAIRLISKASYKSHSEPLFKANKLLKFKDLYRFRSYKLMIKWFKKSLPIPIMNMFATNSQLNRRSHRNIDKFFINNHRLNISRHHILYQGPNYWNTLPNSLTKSKGPINSMVYKFKFNILNSYSSVCSIQNCHSCNLDIHSTSSESSDSSSDSSWFFTLTILSISFHFPPLSFLL